MFKGTPERTAREIAEEVDAVGGDMNAYTTKEYTTFYVRALAEHVELGLDILGDILCRPALRPDEVDAERQVILEEVLMHRDEPADVVQEQFAAAMFPGHPLGREVLGEPEIVTQGDRARDPVLLRRALPAGQHGGRGGRRPRPRPSRAEASRPGSPAVNGGRAPDAPGAVGETIPLVVESRDTEQAQLVLGVRAPDRHSPERFALAVLNHVLGGGLSSRLFQEIRETRGLAYSIGSDRSAYDDAGLLAVSVGTAPEHAHEVLDLLHTELDRLAAEGITTRELEVAKGPPPRRPAACRSRTPARGCRGSAPALLLFGAVLSVEELLARDRRRSPSTRSGPSPSGCLRARGRWLSSGRSRRGLRLELVARLRCIGPVPGRKGYRDAMTRVGVFGAAGRMGATVCAAVLAAADLELVAAVDPAAAGRPLAGGRRVAAEAGSMSPPRPTPSGAGGADVAVDFTVAAAARREPALVRRARRSRGLRHDRLRRHRPRGACGHGSRRTSHAVVAPNFSIGAALMMRCAELCAPFVGGAEVIELHHDRKRDAPSGTSLETVRRHAGGTATRPVQGRGPPIRPRPSFSKAPGAGGPRAACTCTRFGCQGSWPTRRSSSARRARRSRSGTTLSTG